MTAEVMRRHRSHRMCGQARASANSSRRPAQCSCRRAPASAAPDRLAPAGAGAPDGGPVARDSEGWQRQRCFAAAPWTCCWQRRQGEGDTDFAPPHAGDLATALAGGDQQVHRVTESGSSVWPRARWRRVRRGTARAAGRCRGGLDAPGGIAGHQIVALCRGIHDGSRHARASRRRLADGAVQEPHHVAACDLAGRLAATGGSEATEASGCHRCSGPRAYVAQALGRRSAGAPGSDISSTSLATVSAEAATASAT